MPAEHILVRSVSVPNLGGCIQFVNDYIRARMSAGKTITWRIHQARVWQMQEQQYHHKCREHNAGNGETHFDAA